MYVPVNCESGESQAWARTLDVDRIVFVNSTAFHVTLIVISRRSSARTVPAHYYSCGRFNALGHVGSTSQDGGIQRDPSTVLLETQVQVYTDGEDALSIPNSESRIDASSLMDRVNLAESSENGRCEFAKTRGDHLLPNIPILSTRVSSENPRAVHGTHYAGYETHWTARPHSLSLALKLTI